MKSPIAAVMASLMLGLAPGVDSARGQPAPLGFGEQWVRQHPFMLTALQRTVNPAMIKYRSANLNTMLAWQDGGFGKDIATSSKNDGLPWQALILDSSNSRYTNFASITGSTGWIFGDELSRQTIVSSFGPGGFYANQKNAIRAARPNDLIYTQIFPTYASPGDRYGGTPPGGGYTYAQFLDDVVKYAQPDVLMYDHYPFPSNGTTTTADFFDNLMQVRSKALASNLPYWGFAQSFQSNAIGYREPSSSDVRMQAFALSTAGYTGIAYFTFDAFGDKSMLDAGGNQTTIYAKVQSLNAEIKNIGSALRFMTSDDVKWVQGVQLSGGNIVPNPVPAGVAAWTAANDSDDHILSITQSNRGVERNGLLGCFTDDNGDAAFMITNLLHGSTVDYQAFSTTFTLQLDSTVTELLRLDRLTGQQVLVPLTADHQLIVSLPAGTGELYKYNEGAFLVAVPEPVVAPAAMMGFVLLRSLRRRV